MANKVSIGRPNERISRSQSCRRGVGVRGDTLRVGVAVAAHRLWRRATVHLSILMEYLALFILMGVYLLYLVLSDTPRKRGDYD